MTSPTAFIAGATLVLLASLIATEAAAEPTHAALSLARWEEQLVQETPSETTDVEADEQSEDAREAVVVGLDLHLSHAPAAGKPEVGEDEGDELASGATLAEGGRDLTPRFRYVSESWLSPFVALELYGDAGSQPMLLGYDEMYVRLNPVIAMGLSPSPAFTVYAGVGPGGAVVSPSADNPDAATTEDDFAVTGAMLVGLRFTGAELPMVLEARADTVAKRGTSVMGTFSMQIAD